MLKPLLLLSLLGVACSVQGQNLHFPDSKLKQYLLTIDCVDTDQDGTYDSPADLDGDGKVQVSEAMSIRDMRIGHFPDTFFIKSLQGLEQFRLLQRFSLLHMDSLPELMGLAMDSLNFLWIGSSRLLKYIDISDLPAIKDLRIEDLDSLDYLNLKNGSVPSGIFSLFYTENIQFACVDSIAKEFNEVAMHMDGNSSPSLVCSASIPEFPPIPPIVVYPIPTDGLLMLETNFKFHRISLYDIHGRLILKQEGPLTEIDLTELDAGIYLLWMEVNDQWISRKVMKR